MLISGMTRTNGAGNEPAHIYQQYSLKVITLNFESFAKIKIAEHNVQDRRCEAHTRHRVRDFLKAMHLSQLEEMLGYNSGIL